MGTVKQSLEGGLTRHVTTVPDQAVAGHHGRLSTITGGSSREYAVIEGWRIVSTTFDAEGMGVRASFHGYVVRTKHGWTATDGLGRMVTPWHVGSPEGYRNMRVFLRDRLLSVWDKRKGISDARTVVHVNVP